MRKPEFKKKVEEDLSSKRLVNIMRPGMEYEGWTVLGKGKKPDYVSCKCECGVIREVHVYSLKSKKSKSCGCRRKLKGQKNA